MRSVFFRNILGAFSDAAILFPLIILLTSKVGFSGVLLLLSAGLAYLVSAFVFRIPMSVQPLKSIVMTAVALGASVVEVRWGGFFIGLCCLMLLFLNVDHWAKKIPASLIHQIQVGLGVLLVLQGLKMGNAGWVWILVSALMVLFPEVKGVPVLGFLATIGFFITVWTGRPQPVTTIPGHEFPGVFRPDVVISLVVPQLLLTLTNSVLATRDVCYRYFGPQASRVSIRRILCSIGIGNVISAILGGMPFCHGSGGITAHFRGGSTHPASTALMGLALIFLASIQIFVGVTTWTFPLVLLTPLLVSTGVFHLKLAAPTSKTMLGLIKLAISGCVTIYTVNLLWVAVIAICFEFLESLFLKNKRKSQEVMA